MSLLYSIENSYDKIKDKDWNSNVPKGDGSHNADKNVSDASSAAKNIKDLLNSTN